MEAKSRSPRGEVAVLARARYEAWMNGMENAVKCLQCAFCGLPASTIMAGCAVCTVCGGPIKGRYEIADIVNGLRGYYRRMGLPFGRQEWVASFAKDIKRERNREKRKAKKATQGESVGEAFPREDA